MQENNNNSEGKEIEFDVLTEIGNIGAGNATTALSQLINARIDMRVPKVDLLGFSGAGGDCWRSRNTGCRYIIVFRR